jgi:hypothetical protein
MRPALAAACLFALPAAADDKPAADPKAAAVATLKRVNPEAAPATAETDDLVLAWPASPGTRGPALATAAQKAFGVAKAALKFEGNETLWPGKLTVFVLPSAVQYAAFVRVVEGRRADKGAWHALNTRAEAPYVVVSPGRGEKPTDAEQQQDVGTLVGAALVTRKGGATPQNPLPEWLALGFGRAMTAQAEGGSRLTNYRAKAKAAVVGGKGRPGVRLADVWSGTAVKDADLAAASLAEFLATGPAADRFGKFLNGFKPAENGDPGTVAQALEAADWKPETLEAAWKRWVATGK